MPSWKSDLSGMDFLHVDLLDSKSGSSDEDSGCSLAWVDESTFEELDAFLHENPPGWMPYCECGDGNNLSQCCFCLSSCLSDGLFSLPLDDPNRMDALSADEILDSSQTILDRLYPDLKKDRDDLVVLGVDLQALSTAVLSGEDLVPDPFQSFKTSFPAPARSLPPRTPTSPQEWISSLPFGALPPKGAAVPPQRQRRGGGRRAVPEEEKIFPCPYVGCARVYSKNSHLRAHLRRHTGEKPFVCQWPGCKWRFSRSDELARHKRSHSGVKPYQCTVCAKRFGRSDHLAKHVRIHRKQGYVIPPKTNSRASVKVQVLNRA